MFKLADWQYIHQVPFDGCLKTSIERFFNANDKQDTATHCIAVAETSVKLSARFGLPSASVETAALLHDISNVLKPQDMMRYAIQCDWSIGEAEKQYPFLLHQRISGAMAKDVFGIDDEDILSAIECHTTLKSNASETDMIVFLADKLSWDQEGLPPFYNVLSEALNHSLTYASLVYINFVLENGMILFPHRQLIEAKCWLESNYP